MIRDRSSVISNRQASCAGIRAILVGVWVFGCLGASTLASILDDKVEAFKKADTQTEAMVADLLKVALQEDRSAEAVGVVRPWLSAKQGKSASLLFHAGRSMEYAGEWADAIVFCRKLLTSEPLDAGLAAEVVPALYRILVHGLRDTESAYLLMREHGGRLRKYGSASRYDRWFLEEAKRRDDLPAVCSRLGLIYADAASQGLSVESDIRWVREKLEAFSFDSEDWAEAALKLAKMPQVPIEYRARLEWAATVVPYNRELDRLREAKQDPPPKLTDKPLAVAARLMQVVTNEGPFLVEAGWASTYDDGRSGGYRERFAIDGERKVAQLLAAVPGVRPDRRDDLLAKVALWSAKYDPTAVRKVVIKYPGILNSFGAANVKLYDETITVAEAKALAPQLARNPHMEAAKVRAFARQEPKVSLVIAQAMKTDMWRFNRVHELGHHIHLPDLGFFKRDVELAELNKKYEKLDDRYQRLWKQVDKAGKSQDRLAAFAELHEDLLSPNPKIPGLMHLWDHLFANAPAADRDAMLKKLVTTPHGEGRIILERALRVARFDRFKAYYGPAWHYLLQRPWHRAAYQAAMAPIVADVEPTIRAQARAGELSETLFGLWMHGAVATNESARAVMTEVAASSAYGQLDRQYRQVASDGYHFGAIALPPMENPDYVSRELLALKKDSTPALVEAAFKSAMMRVDQSPVPMAVVGLRTVAALPELKGATRDMALMLFNEATPVGGYPAKQGYEQLALKLIKDAQESKQWGEIVPYLVSLWRSCDSSDHPDDAHVAHRLGQYAKAALEDGAPSVALSIARSGLNSGIRWLDPKGAHSVARRAELSSVATKAGEMLGLVEIAVDETDPTYGIRKSNAEYVAGNLEAAWLLYLENDAKLEQEELLRKLSLEYVFWLMKRNVEQERLEQAENLVKALTVWSRQERGLLSISQDGELKIAYADLAFLKGKLPTARAWYRKVVEAKEYKGSDVHVRAALGSVKVDRATRDFDAAHEELDKLTEINSPEARAKVHYARAEVLMDQENFKGALDEIEAVLRSAHNHADGLILRGKIQYQMRKLVEATEIELGVSREDEMMVPGETLKINLNDPTLNISGVGADIEVEVWAKSGDRERVLLHQLGDNKGKYRADVTTALAAPVAGDKTLQVLGVDEIRYGYSQRFRAKMKELPPDPDTVITIASDAHLSFSAGSFPTLGESTFDIKSLGLSTAQTRLGARAVRPGNPVYIRVADPDQSKTAGIDEVAVSLQTSGDDGIRHLLLKETGPYTGVFEGIVPTAGAQPRAFASGSAPGRDANMAISAGDYPGWLGKVGDRESEQQFTVDLNDNVELGTMSLRWLADDQPITHFEVKTSMSGGSWTTCVGYPKVTTAPEGQAQTNEFPTIVTNVPGGVDVPFAEGIRARLVRLSITGFEGMAPGLKRMTLIARTGKAYLPVKQDYQTLRNNKQLEVLPGDEIFARYEDEITATPDRNRHEGMLKVAFNNATISVSSPRYLTTTEERERTLEQLYRFNFGDALSVVVDDVDMDESPKRDVIEFSVVTDAGKTTSLKAVETDAHSGIFVGNVFPVNGAPERESEFQVPEGGALTFSYRDMENLDPGIPVDRKTALRHAKYATPRLGVYSVSSELLPPEAAEQEKVNEEPSVIGRRSSSRPRRSEVVSPRRTLSYNYIDEAQLSEAKIKAVIGGCARFDIIAPHLALSPSSEVSAYVQVAPGSAEGPFDLTLPGTIKLTSPSLGNKSSVPAGYRGLEGHRRSGRPLSHSSGCFSFAVPLSLGDRPGISFATKPHERSGVSGPGTLVVRDGDVVRIGYAYKDDQDAVQWKTASLTVGAHAFLDVMDYSYSEPLRSVYVGERAFVRVVAPGLDKGSHLDSTSVKLKAKSGAAATFKLIETAAHSGVFKGVFHLSYGDEQLPAELPPVELNGFPVRYGDEVTVSYAAPGEDKEQSHAFTIRTGSSGDVELFSKRYSADDMAVKTAFTLAECFFELAKKHCKMDQESLARRELGHAKKLLQESITTHRDEALRAHAEYLLGNLAQEYADLAENEAARLPMYLDALARFAKIPVDYPKSEFAEKAQFKTALVYEKMGQDDIAVEEYVKLAYKYPNSEHIPEVLSRLGLHFQKKGKALKEQADALRQKEDQESKEEVATLDKKSHPLFLRAASIYGKLLDRFPDHGLAGLAGLASAQNYMRATKYVEAIEGFEKLVDSDDCEAEVKAQSLFWTGICYERLPRNPDLEKAYQVYQRMTFDFPESKWTKAARGRLASPELAGRVREEAEKRKKMLLMRGVDAR